MEEKESDVFSSSEDLSVKNGEEGETSNTIGLSTSNTAERIRTELINPKRISKENDSEGRQAVAEVIQRIRKETSEIQEEITEAEKNVAVMEKKNEILEKQKQEKEQEIEKREEKVLIKIKKFVGIADKKTENLQKDIEDIQNEIKTISSFQGRLPKKHSEIKRLREKHETIPRPRELLESYYEWATTKPLTHEQKKEFLKPEVLENLTTEEYIALWRRLNPHYLSHVTRQGFRDHYGHIYHMAGIDEFHNNVIELLGDEKLIRPQFAVNFAKGRDRDSIKNGLVKLGIFKEKNVENAKKRLDWFLNQSIASIPNYPDKTAVHFGVQEVLDQVYGGEEGNEIFFVFPSDVMASQFNFSFGEGGAHNFDKEENASMSDILVWPNKTENPGISIDMGIVFLPENVLVDPETGSKYASQIEIVDDRKRRSMLEDKELVKALVEWAENLKESDIYNVFSEYKSEEDKDVKNLLHKKLLSIFEGEMRRLGFSSDNSFNVARTIVNEIQGEKEFSYERAREIMKKNNAIWKRIERTKEAIPAKEYWERLFEKYPNLKPKHIYYYNGNPSDAVLDFQRKYHIGRANTVNTTGKFLGFEENHVNMWDKKDQRAYPGYGELIKITDEILNKHYENNGT